MSSVPVYRKQGFDFEKTVAHVFNQVSLLLSPHEGWINKTAYHDIFQDVYDICTSPKTLEQFYARLTDFLASFCAKKLQILEGQRQDLVRNYAREFDQFYICTRYLDMTFKAFNQQVEKPMSVTGLPAGLEPTFRRVRCLSLRLWKDVTLSPLYLRIYADAMSLIAKDRSGDTVDLNVLSKVCESFWKIGEEELKEELVYYRSQFEAPLLEATRIFYEVEAQKMLLSNDVSAYMKRADELIAKEEKRAKRLFHKSSYEKILDVCQTELVSKHKDYILADCEKFIARQQFDDLRTMYGLMKRTILLAGIVQIYEAFVIQEGLKKIDSLEASKDDFPAVYVDAVSSVYLYHINVIAQTFNNDSEFLKAFDRACKKIVNAKPKSGQLAAELLAKNCDALLRKSKAESESDFDKKLTDLLTLFSYLDDKDVFQKFYSRSLARRLIHGTSASEEAEEQSLRRLKTLCGYDYTSKLEKMFTDVKLSSSINDKFSSTSLGGSLGFNFSVMILQTGAWPLTVGNNELILPSILSSSVRNFETFYQMAHSGRKLTWAHAYATADVKAYFKKHVFEFNTTTYQLAVLLLFNDTLKLRYGDIHLQTGMNEKELARTVRSLMTCMVLKSEIPQDDSEIDPNEFVTLNDKYANKKKKVKLSSAVQRETQQETQATNTAVNDDRKLFLQAMTVRIMKSRQTLSFNLLVEEIIKLSQARFKPTIPLIKLTIEELIEKAFLERDEANKGVLNYLA